MKALKLICCAGALMALTFNASAQQQTEVKEARTPKMKVKEVQPVPEVPVLPADQGQPDIQVNSKGDRIAPPPPPLPADGSQGMMPAPPPPPVEVSDPAAKLAPPPPPPAPPAQRAIRK